MKKTILTLILILFILTGCNNTENVLEEETLEKEPVQVLSLEEIPINEYTIEEIYIENSNGTIYGNLYRPLIERSNYPLVILSHGLGGNYYDGDGYCEILASHGIAAFTFDFRGGGGRKSTGRTEEMSVMTEVADLKDVINYLENVKGLNHNPLILLGASQGGLVSAIVASEMQDKIDELILTYPAFSIGDVIHGLFNSLDEIPEVYSFDWLTLGYPYAYDLWDYDVFEEIGNYTGPVLLLHGNRDPLVDYSYSEKADSIYKNSKLIIIDGAEHGFYGENFDLAVKYIFDFLQETDIVSY